MDMSSRVNTGRRNRNIKGLAARQDARRLPETSARLTGRTHEEHEASRKPWNHVIPFGSPSSSLWYRRV